MPGKLSHVALRISLLYALLAAVWILVSDKVLVALVHDPVLMEEISVCKGWAFVAVTALLLFGALRGQLRRWEKEAAARRLAETYLAEAQRLSHTGSFGWNVATDEHIWSEETLRIFEYDASKKITTPLILERVYPDDRTIARETLERAAQERRDFDYEHRLLMPNGSVKHLHIVARTVSQEPGNVEFIGAVMDVTAQKRAEEAQSRLNRELRAISNCNQALLRAVDEQTLLNDICRIICDEAGYRMAWVGYAEHNEAKTVRPVAWVGVEEGYLASANVSWADTEHGRGPGGTAIRTGKTVCIQDCATDPRAAPWRESRLQRGYRSSISLPLKGDNAETFGELAIYSTEPNAFSPDEIRLLEELAGDLAFGIMVVRARIERDEAEASLALRSFALDNVREAAFLIDEHGRFHYVNESSCRILGYTREELLAMDVWDIDPDFPKERWPDHWRALQAQRSLTFEGRHRAKDGRVLPVEISANFIEYGGKAYNLALGRDITERKRADERIRQQEMEQRQVLDFTLHLIGVFGPDRKRLYVNRPALDYFGVTLEEWKGISDPFWFFHPDDRERLTKDVYTEAASDVPHEFEARLRGKDGAYRWFLFRDNPFRDEHGRITRWYLSAADIEDRKRMEQALRVSEVNLNRAQEIAHIGSWHLDIARNQLTWSDEVYRMFDRPRGTALSYEAFLGAVYPEDRERVDRAWAAALQGAPYDLEHRILVGDELKWVRERAVVEFDPQGKAVKGIGTVQDITERKRAEEALRLSNAYNRSLVEASLDPLVTIGPDGKITDVNAATEAATGCSRGELIGSDFCDYFTEPGKARAGYEQVFREGMVRDYPLELRHRSGRVMSVLYNASVYRDESGRVIGVFAAARDITERKRAEEALRESETRFRTFVDHATDAFFMLDFEQGTIIDVNRPACESLGYSREELIGKTPLAFDVNLDRATLDAMAKRTAAGETVLFDRHWHRRKDGSLFPVEVHISLFWRGGRRFLLKVARDISDRVRAEEAERSSEAERRRAEIALQEARAELARVTRVTMMGELAASIAHEVNQPLAGVVTSANAGRNWLAKDPPNLPKTREAIERILRDGNRAAEVLNRIRTLLKKTPPAKSHVSVNQIVRDVVALAGGELRQKNVDLSVELDSNLPAIMGDSIQLQQVLLNLIMNAIEAMAGIANRRKTLRIRSELGDLDGKPAVSVKVSDTGVGFSPTDAGRLFEAFYTTKPEGMGMGLWICRSIIESHGGRLTAQSNEGPGATFQVLLPAETGGSE